MIFNINKYADIVRPYGYILYMGVINENLRLEIRLNNPVNDHWLSQIIKFTEIEASEIDLIGKIIKYMCETMERIK